ncbi:hypothetical protein R6Q59_026517 [Mikania micrantha]
MGTKRHHDKWFKPTETYDVKGCFAMTELGHGSNVRFDNPKSDYLLLLGVTSPYSHRSVLLLLELFFRSEALKRLLDMMLAPVNLSSTLLVTGEFIINTPCESAQKYWIEGATNVRQFHCPFIQFSH